MLDGESPLFLGSDEEERKRFYPAILGQSDSDFRIIYSADKIIEILAEDMTPSGDPDDPDDEYNNPLFIAREYYEYNILGAYMGEMTPIYVSAYDTDLYNK